MHVLTMIQTWLVSVLTDVDKHLLILQYIINLGNLGILCEHI